MSPDYGQSVRLPVDGGTCARCRRTVPRIVVDVRAGVTGEIHKSRNTSIRYGFELPVCVTKWSDLDERAKGKNKYMPVHMDKMEYSCPSTPRVYRMTCASPTTVFFLLYPTLTTVRSPPGLMIRILRVVKRKRKSNRPRA